MGHYKAISTDSKNFRLTHNDAPIGELSYAKWYAFDAKIVLADNSVYQLTPKGFWDYKIELKKGEETLLVFHMGWRGIIIKTHFQGYEEMYQLKLKGLLSSKYLLVDTAENELLSVDTDFKWSKLSFDYTIETSDEFEHFKNKELLLLTTIHCVNYHIKIISAAA